MQSNFNPSLQKAFDFLAVSQNADGGWGYRRGGMSYVEPTAFALLALFNPLGAGGQDVPDNRYQAVLRGLTWLRSQQHSDGGWGVMKEDPISGWMTYPVIWLLNVLLKPESKLGDYYAKREDLDMRNAGRSWILNQGREAAADDASTPQIKKIFQIDPAFRGWSWVGGEAGWVIPTALALVALTIEDPPALLLSNEVVNGKEYLRDRACPDGGWNVGNPWSLGKKLPPTPDATAFALVAWRLCLTTADFGPINATVNAGVDYLTNYVTNSDHTAVLRAWALSLFMEASEVDDLRDNLVKGREERVFEYKGQQIKKRTVVGQDRSNTGAWANSPYTTALATLALSDSRYYLLLSKP